MTIKLSTFAAMLLVTTSVFGQNYWFGFVTSTGDTINRKDSLGYWQGLHVNMCTWSCNKLKDTCEYQIGIYKDGQPIGNWTDYKKDKSFSIGQYNTGIEVTPNDKGGFTKRHQGIYAKVGIWKYYDKDSFLVKTERYDRSFNNRGSTEFTYIENSKDSFIIISFAFISNNSPHSRYKTIKQLHYFPENGALKTSYSRNFWKDIFKEYDKLGFLIKKTKKRKFLGRQMKTTITTEYSKGKKRKKIKLTIYRNPYIHVTPTF